jgi:hypothetical protein
VLEDDGTSHVTNVADVLIGSVAEALRALNGRGDLELLGDSTWLGMGEDRPARGAGPPDRRALQRPRAS